LHSLSKKYESNSFLLLFFSVFIFQDMIIINF